MSKTDAAEVWGVVELMGHVRLAGKVSEEEKFGTKMGRIDIPQGEGFITQYFGGNSVYRITTAELDAIRAAAEAATPGPWFAKDSIRNKSEYLAPGELEPTFDNDENTFGWSITVADPSEGYSIVHGENYHSIEDIQKDIDFIATANPATVLRLVEQARPMEWKNEYPKVPGDWLLAGGQFLKNVCVFQMWDEEKIRSFSGEKPQQDIFYFGPLPKPPEAK
jgi:hypothetical protein